MFLYVCWNLIFLLESVGTGFGFFWFLLERGNGKKGLLKGSTKHVFIKYQYVKCQKVPFVDLLVRGNQNIPQL